VTAKSASPKSRSSFVLAAFVFFATVLAIAAAVAVQPQPAPSSAHPVDEDLEAWTTDNRVEAIVTEGDTIYIGGQFTKVGPYTGRGVPVDTASGLPLPVYPKFNGIVYDTVGDGSGGWYVGGSFTLVDEIAQPYVAHVTSAGTVDTTFNPVVNGSVLTVDRDGSTVYIGGGTFTTPAGFSTVEGQPRNNIAAVDGVDGDLLAWDPGAGATISSINVFEVTGSSVYVGGGFTSLGGQARNGLAEIDVTGTATAWNPATDFGATALTLVGTTLYVGGAFTTIGGQPRDLAGAIDTTTALALAWNPNITHDGGASVNKIIVDGAITYLAGFFITVDGEARSNLAAVDSTTGALSPWAPNPNGLLIDMVKEGTTIFAAGDFSTIGGESRRNVGAVSTVTGLATSFNPNAGGRTRALVVDGSTLFIGGESSIIGGVDRNNIAAIDATTGQTTSWNPNANNRVRALVLDGASIYAGGNFTTIGGQSRNRIAQLDVTTGLASSWNPNANGPVQALALGDGVVYAGSPTGLGNQFTSIGGQSRNRIAALDKTTGLATGWNPNSSGEVRTIVVDGTTVYVGGGFTTIGGQPRNRIAALDATLGTATSWNPDAGNTVRTILLDQGQLLVGGAFTTIGGQSRNRLAELDPVTGLASSWDPNVSGATPDSAGTVNGLALLDDFVFLAGNFGTVGGEVRTSLAAIDRTSGVPTSWVPNTSPNIDRLLLNNGVVLLGAAPTTSYGFFNGRIGYAQITLTTVQFAADTQNASESSVTVDVPVALSQAELQDVTVEFATTGGTATPTSDFSPASGTVTIPAGETSGAITLSLVDDGEVEASESIELTLSAPSDNTLLDDRLVTTVMVADAGATPTPGDSVRRISGASARELAINVSKDNLAIPGSAEAAILATEERLVDALAATPLASITHATLLLTSQGQVPAEVVAELERALGADTTKKIYIAGGIEAISQASEDQLTTLGYTVVRFAGTDRNHTASLIGSEIVVQNPAPTTHVYVSENRVFADSLAAGSAAGHVSSAGIVSPIVLVERASTTLDENTATFLSGLSSLQTVTIIGGPQAVDLAITSAIDAIETVDQVLRIEGTDRYATNVELNESVFTGPVTIVVTNGTQQALPGAVSASASSGVGFFSALLAGRLGAFIDAPTIITASDNLSAAARAYIQANAGTITEAIIIGGTQDVSEAVATEVAGLI
jgi:putative cell wall-binding protein